MGLKNTKETPEIVRRGFDFDKKLYNRMRGSAATEGMLTREWLASAIKNELKRLKSKSK